MESTNKDEILIFVIIDYFLSQFLGYSGNDDEESEDRLGIRRSKVDFDIFIVDEVHERKITMDTFMAMMKVKYMKNKLNNRPNMKKLILLSATIDPTKFMDYYKDVARVDIMHVEGRTYPRYDIYFDNKEYLKKGNMKLYEKKIIEVVDSFLDDTYLSKHFKKCMEDVDYKCEINETGITNSLEGDVLVFLPTVSFINKLVDHYKKSQYSKGKDPVFFAGLYRQVNKKTTKYIIGLPEDTYKKDGFSRRVVFSSPIARTGLTIEGITYVIESGIENIVDWNSMTNKREQRISYVTQDSAKQFCGRASRTKPGICIRLYSKKTYNERFKKVLKPEIYKESLHNTLLSLLTFTETLSQAKYHLDNFISPVSMKQYHTVVADFHYHGILTKDDVISRLGVFAKNLGIEYELALLMIESFRYKLQQFMLPIVAMMSIKDRLDLWFHKYAMRVMPNYASVHGEPIAFFNVYKFFSDTFLRQNMKLIDRSHKKIWQFSKEKNRYEPIEVILYYNKLGAWCRKYQFSFQYFHKLIPKMLKIQRKLQTISNDISKMLISDKPITDLSGQSSEVRDKWLTRIFEKVFYKNRAILLPEFKAYNIMETGSTLSSKFRSRFIKVINDEPPKIIGFTDIIYLQSDRGEIVIPTNIFVIGGDVASGSVLHSL